MRLLVTDAADSSAQRPAQALPDDARGADGLDGVIDNHETLLKNARIARLSTCSNLRLERASLEKVRPCLGCFVTAILRVRRRRSHVFAPPLISCFRM